MKKKNYFLAISIFITIAGNCQFIPMNLSYQSSGTYSHWPKLMSITNASTVWLGTKRYNSSHYQVPYSWAVHTSNGGATWQFDSIPLTGQPIIESMCAVDANTCFYDFSNIDWTNSSIWKTSNAGATWVKKTTTQFAGTGGFCDFYHAFDANVGVAVGDPTNGYFEIQRTTNGGDSWTRVPSSQIPPPLAGEWGFADVYSAEGDNVWFAATKADGASTWALRCYKSTDRGQHWTVAPVAGGFGNVQMCFSTSQKGIVVDDYSMINYFFRTSDGGTTWVKDSIEVNGLPIASASAVDGFDGGFVMGFFNQSNNTGTLLFTPDFFANTIVLDSNLALDPFYFQYQNATTGWVCGQGTNTNSIWKYNGLLSSISNAARSPEKLVIVPNPSTTEALVKLPGLNDMDDMQLMIYDATGRLYENRPINPGSGWTKLNATAYKSGVYLIKVFKGDQMVASTKWIVQH